MLNLSKLKGRNQQVDNSNFISSNLKLKLKKEHPLNSKVLDQKSWRKGIGHRIVKSKSKDVSEGRKLRKKIPSFAKHKPGYNKRMKSFIEN